MVDVIFGSSRSFYIYVDIEYVICMYVELIDQCVYKKVYIFVDNQSCLVDNDVFDMAVCRLLICHVCTSMLLCKYYVYINIYN